MINRKKWLLICVSITLVPSAIPFKTTIVPEWKIRVVDESTRPVAGLLVREQWRNHSVEFHGHYEDGMTNSDGYVSFPRRVVRASLLFRLVGLLVASSNIHGQSGVKASAIVLGPYLTSSDSEYSPDKPLPEVIVIRSQP